MCVYPNAIELKIPTGAMMLLECFWEPNCATPATVEHYKNGIFPAESFTHIVSLGHACFRHFPAGGSTCLPKNTPVERQHKW